MTLYPQILQNCERPGCNTQADLASLQLPRSYSQKSKTVMMQRIHTFVDSSEEVFAALSYLGQKYNDGDVSVICMAVKLCVAPLKVITVTRLELVVVVIAIRLSKSVGKTSDMLVK